MKKIFSIILLGVVLAVPQVHAQSKPNAVTAPGAATQSSAPGATQAQAPTVQQNTEQAELLINPLKVDSVEGFLVAVIDVMLTFAMPIVVLFLIWTGFQMVLAQGKADAIKIAKGRFMNVLVGTLLIFGAKLILEILQATIKTFAG